MSRPESRTPAEPSEADRALIAEVAARGRVVSTGQLGRFRDKRLIPTPSSVRGLHGRGNWSVSYPDGTAERVVDVLDMLELPGRRMTLDEIPIWLFAFNRAVTVAEVRRAWAIVNGKVLKKHPKTEEEIDQLQRNIFTQATRNIVGKFLKFRIGKQVIRANNFLGEIFASLVSRMVGEFPNPAADEKLAELLWHEDPEAQSFFQDLLAQAVMGKLSDQVASLDDDQLLRARHHLILGLELLARCIPGVRYENHFETLKNYRNLVRADGWLIMINLMLLAYADEALDFFNSRLIEVVNELRANPVEPGPAPA